MKTTFFFFTKQAIQLISRNIFSVLTNMRVQESSNCEIRKFRQTKVLLKQKLTSHNFLVAEQIFVSFLHNSNKLNLSLHNNCIPVAILIIFSQIQQCIFLLSYYYGKGRPFFTLKMAHYPTCT